MGGFVKFYTKSLMNAQSFLLIVKGHKVSFETLASESHFI